MGGLEQLHPLFQPLCGWAGGAGGAGGIPKATGTAAERCLWKTGREGDEERGKGREGEEQAPGLGVGERCTSSHLSNRWCHPPGPSPPGTRAGATRGVRGSRGGGRLLPNRLQQHVPGEALPGAGWVPGSPGMGGDSASPGWGSRSPPLTQSVRSCLGDHHHHHHHPVEPFVLPGR